MLYENLLEEADLENLKKAVIYEVTNFPCLMVPRYQTYPTMHRKFKHYLFWKKFQEAVLEAAKDRGGREYRVHSCWFNACKQDSNFDWHIHEGYDLTCVYYLLNCENNGTLVKDEDQIIQTPAKDNSLSFMEIGVEHRVPDWQGKDRYSIAVQLVAR